VTYDKDTELSYYTWGELKPKLVGFENTKKDDRDIVKTTDWYKNIVTEE